MKYVYFISYSGKSGYGDCEVYNNKLIESMDDINILKNKIIKGNPNVPKIIVITFYSLLRKEE